MSMDSKLKKTIAIIALICMSIQPLNEIGKKEVYAAHGVAKFQQQINVQNGEFSTTNTTYSPTDNALGMISFDPAEYDGETVYFEVLIKCDTCSGGNNQASASLYSDSGSSISTLSTTNGTYTLLRSGSLSLSADNYTVRFRLDASSGTAYIKAARLIIDQAEGSGNGIGSTQTQIEVGHYENTNSTTAQEITSPKYYVYEDSKFSGTKNAYFEATLRTTGSTATETYYFDAYDGGGEEWTTNPGNLTDSSGATYASTNLDGDVELLNGNTSTGTNLGAITKVEVRARAYQDNDTSGSITLRPIFSGGDGNNHGFTPPQTVGDWSSYIDITTDLNAPNNWSWVDIQNLDLDVVWNQNVGSNTGFIAKVEIRVTYEDSNVVAYAELYNKTNSTIVETVSTSSENFQRVRSSPLSTNWDLNNPDQYAVRIYSSNAGNTAYLSNAKIIIDQTESGGIKKLELAHQYLTTDRSQTNTSYTQDSFVNDYQPENFDTPHTRKTYFDVTLKTTGGTGFASLYNVSGAEAIDAPINSEVTTTSTSYEQKKSNNLGDNTDWPMSTKSLDTIIKASSTFTTTISSSRLLIEIANIDPSFVFSISGVANAQVHNGITTSVTSTSTTLPFGSITPGSPAYAAHEISVDTNDANVSYSVSVGLTALMQGLYPGNNIDPFSGSGATWNNPQNWIEPTGVIKNSNTGWLGANTTDTTISGWSDGNNKFGPISTSDVTVMQSENGSDKTEYVSFAIEANAAQPADMYSSTLIYSVFPTF